MKKKMIFLMTTEVKRSYAGQGKKRFPACRALCVFLSALLVFLSLSVKPGWFGGTVALAEGGIDYVDADGSVQTRDSVTALTGGTTSWTGWYMVSGEITVSAQITVSGEAHLILCDGAALNAARGIIVEPGNSLTIYGQVEGTGRLVSTGKLGSAGIGGTKGHTGGTITINGGTVAADGGSHGAGIGGGQSGSGGTITINGGTVTANGGSNSAGIGGGDSGSGGAITIDGGTVTANGRSSGAGIGGGKNGTGGSIVISQGNVIATGGDDAAGIGGGDSGDGGMITIYQGEVTASGGRNGAGIGSGKKGAGGIIKLCGGTVTAVGGSDGAGIGGGYHGTGGTIRIDGGEVSATGGKNGAGIGGGYNGDGGYITISGGSVVAVVSADTSGKTEAIGHGYGSSRDSGYLNLEQMKVRSGNSASSAGEITGSGWVEACRNRYAELEPCADHQNDENGICLYCGYGTSSQEVSPAISWKTLNGSMQSTEHWKQVDGGTDLLNDCDGNWYAVTEDVTLTARLEISGTVNLILCDGTTLTVRRGIHLPTGSSLTIWPQSEETGKLLMRSARVNSEWIAPKTNQAGIGGNSGENGGVLIVNGGTIQAYGGNYAAGIGGGHHGAGGKVIINRGIVNAQGSTRGAGIGGGEEGSGGIFTISGGTVNATSGKDGAGIGGGENGSGGSITISGGTVNVTGGQFGAGIGGGVQGSGGNITISGGTVNATGGKNAAAIGGGQKGSSGSITISGGTVNAGGSDVYAGIGSGNGGSGGIITITDGNIQATGDRAGAGIGFGDSNGSITIDGGVVWAQGAANGAGIGGGMNVPGGTITIRGGEIQATGGNNAAGIGGGSSCSGGVITIYGGTVIATGGQNGAGIGGGSGKNGSGGAITIHGGDIRATSNTCAAGIGGGKNGAGGVIIITDGRVMAKGARNATGIGTGELTDQKGCTVMISGGQITAKSSDYVWEGAAIGTVNRAYSSKQQPTIVSLGWTRQSDYIQAGVIAADTYEVESPFHYQSPDGEDLGPATADNLRNKNHDSLLVPDYREEAGVVIPQGDQRMTPGDTCVLTAAVTAAGEGTGTWRWRSDDPAVARIDETDGGITVTAVSEGETRIRACYLSETTAGEAGVTVAVAQLHTVTVAECEHGTVAVDSETVLSGDPVTLTVSPDGENGYRLGSLTVTCPNREIEIVRSPCQGEEGEQGETGGTGQQAVQGESVWTFTMPEEDVIVSAVFCRYCLVSFVNDDGTLLQQFDMLEGDTPAYSGETPEHIMDEEYIYTFAGWDPEIVSASGDAAYTAVYDKTLRRYGITFVDEDDTVLQYSEVEYGEIPEYEGAVLIRAMDEQGRSYAFSGWTPEIGSVSGEATYKAVYTEVSSLSMGENTVSVSVWVPITLSFIPEEDSVYHFYSDPGQALTRFRIYDGEDMEARAEENMQWGGGYSFDCVAELTAGKTYMAEFMAYNCSADLSVHIEKAAMYSIGIGEGMEHGTIEFCESTAYPGKNVDIFAVPDDGYDWTGTIITGADGNVLFTKSGYEVFTMPSENITVTAVFEKLNRILFKLDDRIGEPLVVANGLFWDWENARATPGSLINLLLFCDTNEYEIDSVDISTESGKGIPCYMYKDDEGEYIYVEDEDDSAWIYWFVMPDEPVYIRVTRTRGEEEPEPEPEPRFEGATFTLPAGLREIGESAFEGDRSIFIVDIPEDCRYIGKWAFRGCSNLWKVRIPEECGIGEDAFEGCGSVYVFGKFGSPAYDYCLEHLNCGFIEE